MILLAINNLFIDATSQKAVLAVGFECQNNHVIRRGLAWRTFIRD